MLSFGGGAHMCSGRRFGYLQVSTIWSILLRDFELEMVTPLPKPAYNDMVVGPDAPIMMRYKRKKFLTASDMAERAAKYAATATAAKAAALAAAAGGAPPPVASSGGGVSLVKSVTNAAYPNGPMLILWGSQTGTAESFGKILRDEARQRGFDARSIDLEEYNAAQLAEEDEAPVIFLMATHGEGEPTDNAVAFYKYIENEQMGTNLKAVRFGAFALGNKQYQHFCAMGKWVDAKVAALGGMRICPLGLGDDDDDLEGDFEKWRETLWAALLPSTAGAVAGGAGGAAPPALSAPAPNFDVEWLATAEATPTTLQFLARTQPKHTLCECTVAVNRELAAKPECGSVRHLELETGAMGVGSAAYKMADDLAVCPDNGVALATQVRGLPLMMTCRACKCPPQRSWYVDCH
jgi:NADPH-ferrihemoprotein reductase